MKKFGFLALLLSLALVGCKPKEETTPVTTGGTTETTTSTTTESTEGSTTTP